MHLYILVYISSCNQGSFHTFVLFHFYTKNIYIRVNFYNKIIIIKQLFPNIKSNYHEFGIIFSRQLCVVAITYIYVCKGEIVFIDAIEIFADRCRCRVAVYPWKFPTNGVVAALKVRWPARFTRYVAHRGCVVERKTRSVEFYLAVMSRRSI